jgi:hypothetical protein
MQLQYDIKIMFMTYLLRILFHSQKFIQTSFMKFHVWNVSSCIYKGKKTPKYFGNCINRNSASVHPRPHIKRPSKPISNKKNEKTTTTYQLGFSKFQPFSWHPGCNVEGEPAISCMLAKSFAQKVDSNFRKINRHLWKKNQGTTQYWNVHQVLLWTMSSFLFGDKFVKHFSLEFQQLNWFCQVLGAEH